MELTISRKIWMRGEKDGILLEFDKDGNRKQCCVGIYMTALGVKDDAILNIGDAANARQLPEEAWWLMRSDHASWLMRSDHASAEANELYRVNDSQAIIEDARETAIAHGFAQHGVEVKFVD